MNPEDFANDFETVETDEFDTQYERYIDGFGGTIDEYDFEDSAYGLDDPKHETFHDRYSEIADNYDPF